VTDEALEKKFRDTFKSQGGAELVDDLYASGVIVPIVDFTSSAEGSALPQNLQTAWDSSTGLAKQNGVGRTTAISNTGFWLCDLIYTGRVAGGGFNTEADVDIFDGTTANIIWAFDRANASDVFDGVIENKFVAFLRAGDSLRIASSVSSNSITLWYRQIADVNGNLVNPLGFTFS
jgi:hypothetical protein